MNDNHKIILDVCLTAIFTQWQTNKWLKGKRPFVQIILESQNANYKML